MNLSLHKLVGPTATAATLLLASTAYATPQIDEIAAEEAGAEEAGAEEAGAEEAGAGDPDEKKADSDDLSGTSWGVGGEDVEGRYAPRGKTGKLKELEEEEQEEHEEATGPAELPPAGYAMLDFVAGFGDLAVPSTTLGSTDVEPTVSFLIAAGYRFNDVWELTLRVPISSGFNNGPVTPFREKEDNICFSDSDCYRQIAFGGVELGVRPAFILSRSWRLPIGLAFTLPTAQGDLNAGVADRGPRGQAVVNLAAAASRGWQNRALFAHQRMGITPSVGLLHRKQMGPGVIDAVASTKVEIMLKTHGEDPLPREQLGAAEPQSETRGVAVNWVTRLGTFYDLMDGLVSPGLHVWLAVGSSGDIKVDTDGNASQDFGGPQFVLEPSVRSSIPLDDANSFGVQGRLGYIIPAGGPLGGGTTVDAGMGGLRVAVGMYF